jgi:hypothetical protein
VNNSCEIRRDERDEFVVNVLNNQWQRIADIVQAGLRFGTVRASLKRLEKAGRIEKRWDGNQRYGRFVYKIAL